METGQSIIHILEMRTHRERLTNLPSMAWLANGGPQAHTEAAPGSLWLLPEGRVSRPGRLSGSSGATLLNSAVVQGYVVSVCHGGTHWHSLPVACASPSSPELTMSLAALLK